MIINLRQSVFTHLVLLVSLASLAACQTESPNTSPSASASASAQSSASPAASASPTASPSPSAAPAASNDPPAEIRRIAECVQKSGTAAASTASTIADRANLAQMAMSQNNLAQAQQQLEFVRNSVSGLEKQYNFKCVN